MIEWIDNHGLVFSGMVLVGYYVVISILGTMPDPGPTASYGARWAYAAVHALCGNLKTAKAALTNGKKE